MLLRLRTGNFGSLFSEGVEPEPPAPPATQRQRRRAALHETLSIRARRLMRVVNRLLRPRRVADLPATFDRLLREHLVKPAVLPDPRGALPAADGLAGLATDLAPASMMDAYGKGLSPSACLGPVAWHSRETRLVAAPADILTQAARSADSAERDWSVAFDCDIECILAHSGRPPDHSPIMPARLLAAFAELFDAGFVHSFAARDAQGETIGGGFGVAVGGVFMIEGAFESAPGAAAFCLAHLARRLREAHFSLVECAPDATLLGLASFSPMQREDFLALLALHLGDEKAGRWRREDAASGAPATAVDRRLAA